MAKFFQSALNWIAKKFSDDPSKMLITTSVIGWLLSSFAQILAIAVNPKIKEEQKLFLIPQEFNDALVNIGAFLLITQVTKTTVANLFKTGKFAPKCVRNFLNKSPELYANKVGKLDFNLEEALKSSDAATQRAFRTYSTFGTTVATVGAGIIATNIITPIIRNKMASRVQKSYIDGKGLAEAPIIKQVPQPVVQTVANPTRDDSNQSIKQPLPIQSVNNITSKGSMRI